MLLPALGLLAVCFFAPVGWFLSSALSEAPSIAAGVAKAMELVTSPVSVRVIYNTLFIAVVVTGVTLLIGYPISYMLTRLKGLAFNLLLACVIVPYFTSVVVRTYAWMVLLGRNGVINQVLVSSQIAARPFEFMYNTLGVVIGMTYVLLPYMVLTLFTAMRGLDPNLLQAAAGMGASALSIFRRVFFPLTLPGVTAGSLIVFMLAIGYFITPALMGGARDMMIGQLIEREVEMNQNWFASAVLTLLLLVVILSLYGVYRRLGGNRARALP